MILDKKMQVFMTVADSGSFSQAGRRLSLSQSVVSFHIDALEKELGISLFNRMGRSISLTPEGTLLYTEGQKICRTVRDLENNLFSLAQSLENRIYLGGDALTCVFTLPWTLAAYREEHPDIIFTYRHFDHDALQANIVNGEIDLALSGHAIRHQKLTSHRCFSDEIIYVSNIKNSADMLSLQDIRTRPLIWAAGDRGLELLLVQSLSAAGIQMKDLDIFMEVEDIAILKNFVQAGVASAFLPRVSVQNELRFGILKEIPIPGLKIERHTYLIHPKGKALRSAVTDFMNFVQQQNWSKEMEKG